MAHPIQLKQEAIRLRKKGLSIPKISDSLSIAKSTASLWVSSTPLPENIRSLLVKNSMRGNEKGREVMRVRRFIERENINKESFQLLGSFNNKIDRSFWELCAAILFWCEGSKRNFS